MKDAALRLALEFVEANHAGGPDAFELINTIKQALEQPEPEDYPTYDGYIKKALEETPRVSPEPEPVAWGVDWGKAGDSTCVSIIKRLPGGGIEVVAVEYGPKREWQGLTDEQKVALCKQFPDRLTFNAIHAIEAKLKAKNGFPQTEKNI